MPKIINMKSVRECLRSIRPTQPTPGGPPPTTESPVGPPPPEEPVTPTPATGSPEDEESTDNDAGDAETVEDVDGQNAETSGQLRQRPGGKSCKGTTLHITAVNTYKLHKDVRFEVFMAVTMKNGVFWDVTPRGSCKNRRFGGT
jgi:hypothetical protein